MNKSGGQAFGTGRHDGKVVTAAFAPQCIQARDGRLTVRATTVLTAVLIALTLTGAAHRSTTIDIAAATGTPVGPVAPVPCGPPPAPRPAGVPNIGPDPAPGASRHAPPSVPDSPLPIKTPARPQAPGECLYPPIIEDPPAPARTSGAV